MSLQWIKFTESGKEKEVNAELANRPDLQKQQKFILIDGPGGNPVSADYVPAPNEKKSAKAATGEMQATDYSKSFLKQFAEGKAYAEIAKGTGLHWKHAKKIVDAEVEKLKAGDKTPAGISEEYGITEEQAKTLLNQ